MSFDIKLPVAAVTIVLALGASSTAFAKAHDQGIADGFATPDSTSGEIQSLGGQGVSSVVNNGARGFGASTNGGDNAVDPVVGNEPD